jgi:hypothetical protein
MKLFLYIGILVLLAACHTVTNGYYHSQRKSYHFEEKYFKADTLRFQYYIINGMATAGGNGRHYWSPVNHLNFDSLFNHVEKSLIKLDIPILIEKNLINKYTKNLYSYNKTVNPTNQQKINIDTLKSIVNTKGNNELIFIPIVNFYFDQVRTGAGPAGLDPYPTFVCHLTISIFIFRNNEIIYHKRMRHTEMVDAEYHPFSYLDFKIPIPQEHWDGLVREVMKEYIEQLN